MLKYYVVKVYKQYLLKVTSTRVCKASVCATDNIDVA